MSGAGGEPDRAGSSIGESAPSGPSAFEYATVLASHLRSLVFVPILLGGAALGITYLLPKTFTATTAILVPQQQPLFVGVGLPGGLGGLAGAAAGLRNPADQYASLLQSTTVKDRLIDRFELMKAYDEEMKVLARRELDKRTRVTVGRRDSLIVIDVEDEVPQRAADLANAYIEELRTLTSRLAITEAQQRRVLFEKRLQETNTRLAAAQRELQAAGFNEGALRAEPRASVEQYAKLRAEVTALELRLQSLQSVLADTSPEVMQAKRQLTTLQAQLAQRERANTGAADGRYIDKLRAFKYEESLFELFARQLELARADEAREGGVIQIVDRATPPERKTRPRRALIAMGTAAGSFLALLVFVIARHAWRNGAGDTETERRRAELSAALRRSLGMKRI
jgi:uncharacterized protein involved in exopolysaccharide biosynthesis